MTKELKLTSNLLILKLPQIELNWIKLFIHKKLMFSEYNLSIILFKFVLTFLDLYYHVKVPLSDKLWLKGLYMIVFWFFVEVIFY